MTLAPEGRKLLRIEARNANDDFDAMEQIALADEMAALCRRHSGVPYLVFPEDRNRPIKLQFELRKGSQLLVHIGHIVGVR